MELRHGWVLIDDALSNTAAANSVTEVGGR
jgi:hypothetical protein